MIMYTFFEENADALGGRILVPFNTHEGSGFSGFDKKLAVVCTEATVVTGTAVAGLVVTGSVCQFEPDQVDILVGGWISDIEVSKEVSFEDSPADESIGTTGETAGESSAVLFFAPVSL